MKKEPRKKAVAKKPLNPEVDIHAALPEPANEAEPTERSAPVVPPEPVVEPRAEAPVVEIETCPPTEVVPVPAVTAARETGQGIRDVYDRVNGYLLDVLRANEELTRQSVLAQIRTERERILQTEFEARKNDEEAILARERARTATLRVEVESLVAERERLERTRADLEREAAGEKSAIQSLSGRRDSMEREVERLKEKQDHLERDVSRLEKLRDEYLETIEKIMARKEELRV